VVDVILAAALGRPDAEAVSLEELVQVVGRMSRVLEVPLSVDVESGFGPRLEDFRALFGDERADYQKALDRHYGEGPPARWEDSFISAYSTLHPWEDWAESWAHYLHMVDALETAGATGLALRPKRPDEPQMQPPPDPLNPNYRDFDAMIEAWLSLTYVLNNLSRGLGLPDSYPFVLSAPAIRKLRFIHDTINAHREANARAASAA